jgi:hypothetical protein
MASNSPEYARAYYERNREKLRAQQAAFYRRNSEAAKKRAAEWHAANPEKVADTQRRHRARYPQKTRARDAVSKALKRGKLVRQPCEVCGISETEAHHTDYTKPLDVQWFCRPHHRAMEAA